MRNLSKKLMLIVALCCTVLYFGCKEDEKEVAVTSVSVSPTSITLTEGGTQSATVTVLPKEANQRVIWSSDRASVATVDGEGLITAIAPGITTVTATSESDPTQKASLIVTVNAAVYPVESVRVEPTSVRIEMDATATIVATVLPELANQTVTWYSENTSVASVKNGVITGVWAGTTNITVISEADATKTASVEVTVTTPSREKADRNCITDDTETYFFASEEIIRQRFDMLKAIGTNVLRCEVSWRDLELGEGAWYMNSHIFSYLTIAKEYGFRIKLIIGVMMSPPPWYLDKYPESRLRDEDGRTSENTMSLWYPGLKALITEKSTQLINILKDKGLWDNVDYIIPSYGPAGEPLYPPLWTLAPDFPGHTFWGYDVNAQKSFNTWAQNKYTSLSAANAAWNTAFATWNDVVVLKPGIQPGKYWEDMLTWYRDSKREYIAWQTQQTLDLVKGENKKIVIYVPGTEYTDANWAAAVSSAGGNDNIKIMADSRFLIDLAEEKGCMLQYTGMPAETEVKRLRAYMDAKNYKVEMWGENAGDAVSAGNPDLLARIIVQNRLFGLDYTKSNYLFKEGTLEPTELMEKLKIAFKKIN
ncbi:MAG: Ig-like domain-containing protein [Tannerella sp.]|jgi:hypothetical protein|nr:Ig-like domain-containing protein [Tannerella sp.]